MKIFISIISFLTLYKCVDCKIDFENAINVHGECGIRSNEFNVFMRSRRVIGGKESKKSAWPWMVSLNTDEKEMKNAFPQSSWHECGASLINRQWVLTAAHCVSYEAYNKKLNKTERIMADVSRFTATIGSNDAKSSKKHKIVKIIIYPGGVHTADDWYNDAALIKLEKPVKYSESIRPVCLIMKNETIKDFGHCTLAAWGLQEIKDGKPVTDDSRSSQLSELDFTLSSFDDCTKLAKLWGAGDAILKFMNSRNDYALCASNKDVSKGANFGDSGSPLVCFRNGVWSQVGIVWRGINPPKYAPDWFIFVRPYINWMAAEIIANS